jgi:uncharacterized protein (TIGR02996 family)
MSEDERFLQALRQNPDDDATRSVYADWLEERGDPRAGLLRLELQLHACRQRLVVLHQQTDPTWVRQVRRSLLDPEAAIVPGVSAAGIAIGSPAAEVLAAVPPHDVAPLGGMLRYRLGLLDLWVENGRITQIGLYFGYHGRLAEGIGIGSTIAEIEEVAGPVTHDDEDNLIVRGSSGWCFQIEGPDQPPRRKPPRKARVTGIYVFEPGE